MQLLVVIAYAESQLEAVLFFFAAALARSLSVISRIQKLYHSTYVWTLSLLPPIASIAYTKASNCASFLLLR